MGQLERYGLYVLVLVIFLILGVAVFGGDPQMPKLDNQQAYRTPVEGEGGESALLQSGVRADSEEPKSPSKDLSLLFSDPIERPADSKARDASAKKRLSDDQYGDIGDVDFDTPGQPTPVTPPAPTVLKHTISRGDNPTTIARKYGVRVKALMAANPGVNAAHLVIGKTMSVPTASERKVAVAPLRTGSRTKTVVVRKGEVPGQVAYRVFGSSKPKYVQKIMKAAGITDEKKLWAGTKLVLTVD